MGTVVIKDILGADVRSRNCIELVRKAMGKDEDTFMIDMGGVEFISRSFADELYNLSLPAHELHIVNKNDNVGRMLEVVWKGRKGERVRSSENVEIQDYKNVDDFFAFLKTL